MSGNGMVIWLTGMSGAGKTTVANRLAEQFTDEGLKVEVLDGDLVRENLSRGLGFSREDRNTNVLRIGFVARILARNGVIVLVAAISPYRESRENVRQAVESDGTRFVEVFVGCPLDVLIERDVKGLYQRAIRGEIGQFTGISDPYEEPLSPDCVLDSSAETVEQSVRRVLAYLSTYAQEGVAVYSRPVAMTQAGSLSD